MACGFLSAVGQLRQQRFDVAGQCFVFAVSEEVFLEFRTSNGAFNQILIETFQNGDQVVVGHCFYGIRDFFVTLLRNNAIARIATAAFFFEQLGKQVFRVQFSAPAKAFSVRNGYGVTVVDLREQVSIRWINNQTTDYARERVTSQHGALASTAASHNEISSARVQQNSSQNTVLDVGQLCGIFNGVLTVVVYSVAQRCNRFGQRLGDDGVFGSWLFSLISAIFMFVPFL